MLPRPCRCDACKERRQSAFFSGVAKGFKTGSLAAVMAASFAFWAIGLGATIDLLFGATPVICKQGGQHGTE